MAEIRFEQVSKVFPREVHAVEQLTLHVEDGQFVVLVGPSGCGKTTSLRMVAGLETVSEGTIRIGNRVVNDVPAKDRDVAMVFQNYALYPHMSVYQNMAFGLKMRRFKRAEIDRRVAWAAGMLGIEELLRRKPKELSGGQRQRVAVGRAIVRRPKAYLFDEPLSNLDARLRLATRAELKRLHQRLGTTTLYVTHDQEEAMTLGDHVAVMDRGRLQQSDAPLAVYNRPANRFVAGFLGMPPMNFLDGALRAEGGEMWFEGAGVRLRIEKRKAPRLEKHLGEPVVLGIRPEAIEPCSPTEGNEDLRLAVGVVEPVGSLADVYASTTDGTSMVARVRADHGLSPGDRFSARVDPAGIHVFEQGEYGVNLTRSEG